MVTRPLSNTDFCAKAGTNLKETRLKRKLTIDTAAAALRIPPNHLIALEEGNLSIFSAEVYAKGAYKKYASYLEINCRDSWHAFLRSLANTRRRVPLKLPLPSTWLQRVLTPSGVLVLSIALGVLLVAGYISLQVSSFVRLPDLIVSQPAEAILSGSEVLVQGSTEATAEVRINDENILLNQENKFEYMLPLKSGINVLRIEAKGASGRTRVVTKHLLVPRS